VIPTKTEDRQITSTVEGESIRMQIDSESIEHIVQILTDLYSDPEMAIVREVSTNALDSHIAAGQTRPIEITTPTALQQLFVVQDWGLGLDAEDFRNLYSLYGKSTKTTTNEQTGSLGLGCKSPLTYTNQFTVMGVKDGIKTSALVTRDEDGIPTIEIVDQDNTDEPNGVKVVIPTKRYNEIETKARRLFLHWPEGSVLLNGQAPARLQGTKVTDSITQIEGSCSYIVMCNVPYPLERQYVNEIMHWNQNLVFTVPAGDVHFTPSREGLHYTGRTKKTIERLIATYQETVIAAAQKAVDACATRHEAVDMILKYRSTIKLLDQRNRLVGKLASDLTYKGETVPGTIKAPTYVDIVNGQPVTRSHLLHTTDGSYGYKSRAVNYVEITTAANALWIYGYDKNVTPTAKKKVWLHLDQKGDKYPGTIIFVNEKITNPWIDPAKVIPWEPIDALRLPRPKKTSAVRATVGTYDTVIDGSLKWGLPTDQLDMSQPIFWAESRISAVNSDSRLRRLDCYDKVQVCIVHANRLAKFKRIFPDAQNATLAYRDIFNIWWESLALIERQGLALKSTYGRNPGDLVIPTRVFDPELKQLSLVTRYQLPAHIETISKKFHTISADPLNPVGKMKRRYPLAGFHTDLGSSAKLHNTIYCNAIYKEFYANA
jgi:hypothetical protein